MFSCEDIQTAVSGSSLIRTCSEVRNGSMRLMTPFIYPEGSNVDVYVEFSAPLLSQVQVTDGGQAVDFLSDLSIDPNKTKKRRQMALDICRSLDVTFDGWQVKSEPVGLDGITDAMLRVAQASIRLADLMFTQRLQSVSIFKDEVEEFIADLGVPYESEVLIPGIKGTPVPVDFQVQGGRQDKLVLLLARGSHQTANEVFVRWHELRNRNSKLLTILNDQEELSVRGDDIARLEEYSIVLPWQDRTGLKEVLAA